MVLGLVIWQAMWCTVILFRSILQGIVSLRMCEQWQTVVEPIWFFPVGVCYGLGLQETSTWFGRHRRKNLWWWSIMSHHRYFMTHGSMLNTGWTFPVPLIEAMLRFMEHKVKKSQFSLFVAIGFIYIISEVTAISFIILISGTWCIRRSFLHYYHYFKLILFS